MSSEYGFHCHGPALVCIQQSLGCRFRVLVPFHLRHTCHLLVGCCPGLQRLVCMWELAFVVRPYLTWLLQLGGQPNSTH